MIQAGTMSTGSAWTCGVVGAYWISSIDPIAQDDAARGDGDVAPDLERLGAGRRQVGGVGREVSEHLGRAAHAG